MRRVHWAFYLWKSQGEPQIHTATQAAFEYPPASAYQWVVITDLGHQVWVEVLLLEV